MRSEAVADLQEGVEAGRDAIDIDAVDLGAAVHLETVQRLEVAERVPVDGKQGGR